MSITVGQPALASDFVSTSSGASDSGRVPKLDANGLLDKSFQGIFAFTADEDLTVGQSVGISNYLPTNSVARALRKSATASISFTVNSNLERQGQAFAIGGDKFVFLNSDTAADTLYATVGSITPSTKSLALGTSVAVTADETTPYYVGCKLDTDKFIVFYLEDASTTIIKYRIGTVSGTTITFGSATTFATGATAIVSLVCDQIGTEKGIIFYGASTVTDSRLIAFTTSGTTATAGTPLAIGTTIDNVVSYPMIKKVATDKFIIACDSGSTASNYCQVGTLSGTTITLGTETVFSTNDNFGNNNYSMKIVSPTDNVVVIHHNNSGNTGEVVAGTISGTTPTFGTPVTTNQFDTGLLADSTTSLLISNITDNLMRKYSLSGTTIALVGYAMRTTPNISQMINTDNSYYIGVHTSSTTFTLYIKGMTNMFHGIVENTVSKGGTAKVKFIGVNANQSGLIPGALYQPDGAGGLTNIGTNTTINTPDDKFVTAISATEVLI